MTNLTESAHSMVFDSAVIEGVGGTVGWNAWWSEDDFRLVGGAE